MAMKSDNFGFLMGDPADWGEALKLWTHIRDDVRGMHQALVTNAAGAKRVMNNEARPISASTRRPPTVLQIVSGPVAQPASPLQSTLISKEVLRAAFPRDAKGRFISSARAATPKALPGNPGQSRDSSGKFDSNVSRSVVPGKIGAVAASASHALDRAPDVDPGIAAAKELSAIVTPIGRGVGKMFGSGGPDKKKMVWIKRLWTELRGLRREETAFNKANLRKLTAIENKPTTGGAGGLFSFLPKMPKLPALAGIGGMLATVLGKGAKGLAGLGKGLLRRIPVLGGLLAGGSALASMFGDDDPNKTPEENRHDRYTGAGSGIGALVGGGLGLLLGPVGGIVGGMLGDKLGEVMGGWLSTLDWDQIGATITATWDGAVQKISDGWDAVIGFFKDKFELAKNAVITVKDSVVKNVNAVKEKVVAASNSANDAVKEKIGVDVKAAAQAAANAVKDAAVAAVQTVDKNIVVPTKTVADAAVEYGKQRLERAGAPIGRMVNDRWAAAKDYLIGGAHSAGVDPGVVAQIAHFESGFDKDAAPIQKNGKKLSSAHGYGQFLDATWTEMLNKYGAKYGIDGAGKLSEKEAEKYRHDPKIQAGMLAEFTQENLEKGRKSGAADDAANVYAYHNLGAGDAGRMLNAVKNNPEISVRDALTGGRKIGEKERLRIETVIKNNTSLYGDGTLSAATAYKNMGNKMRLGDFFAQEARSAQPSVMPSFAAASQAPVLPNISAITNVPTAHAVARMPDIPDMPTLQSATQLNSRALNTSVTVVAPKSDVGQDVRDRGIAHVATGGMSGSRWL